LKLAMAEIYVQGVSTRKVAVITEEFGGVQVPQCGKLGSSEIGCAFGK